MMESEKRPPPDATPDNTPSVAPSVTIIDHPPPPKKGLAFWLVFLSLCLSTLLSAIELTSVGTALPTIVHALNGDDFVWAGSAYALAATAFLPLFGGLANIWGRKIVMVSVLSAFIVGSAICGAAQNMNMLIAGRTLQGIGSGGILGMTEIIVSDMVPLRERGPYQGIIGVVWGFASAIGPPIGGALSDKGQWRWLFYLNLPLGAIALLFVGFFLNFKVPQTNVRQKLAQMDWIGNFLVIASTASCTIALAWAGISHPWSSAQVLVPLILGFAGLGVFLFYEARFAKVPVVPIDLFQSRSAASGYATTFFHGFVSIVLTYYLPAFFQASKGASPIRSSVYLFGTAFSVAPGAIVAGVSVQILNRYRPQNWIAWVLIVIGFGLLSTLDVNSGMGKIIGYQILEGFGLGLLFTATTYPILASVSVERTANALALFTFMRSFANTWGVTIGSTILQNQLSIHLPTEFVSALPTGVSIAYATIPQIPSLPSPLKEQVEVAFAKSMSVLWQVMIGIAGAGLLSALPMEELTMHLVTDENWGFEEKAERGSKDEATKDVESGAGKRRSEVEPEGSNSA